MDQSKAPPSCSAADYEKVRQEAIKFEFILETLKTIRYHMRGIDPRYVAPKPYYEMDNWLKIIKEWEQMRFEIFKESKLDRAKAYMAGYIAKKKELEAEWLKANLIDE